MTDTYVHPSNEKAVVIISGGMDSTVLAYGLASGGNELLLVSFDYGQRHRKELMYATRTADKLGAKHRIVDMAFMRDMLHTSALTNNDIEVPHGHYADDNMRLTVVPNRNAIMLSIATGIAVAEQANFVATGVHAGDHAVYPDCRPEFISAMNQAMVFGNEGFASPYFQIMAPFVEISKTDIARIGDDLGVPWEDTWSCYEGGEIHCGKCGTCVERIEAFRDGGVDDPTEYAM